MIQLHCSFSSIFSCKRTRLYAWGVITLLCQTLTGFSQQSQVSFKHITTLNGLSQNAVNCIIQDQKGYMWFGTWDGLNKYDGYTFTTYRNDPNDTSSISCNRIVDMLEDKAGMIWIATVDGGLNKFDRQTNTFTQYKHHKDRANSISSNNLKSGIVEDSHGDLWIGTVGGGLNKYDKKNDVFTVFKHDPANPESLANNEITHLKEDNKGNLWIGTKEGLDLFNRNTHTFIHFQHSPSDNYSLSNNYIRYIFEDSKENIWVGTNKGINKLNQQNNTFTRFTLSGTDSLSRTIVRCISEDTEGRLWLGTENEGLIIYNPQTNLFRQYLPVENNPASINNLTIYDIYKDNKNNMWLGTHSGGVNFYDRNSKKFIHYKKNAFITSSLNNNDVNSFAEDKNGDIWIATDGGGMNLFNRRNGSFTHYTASSTNQQSIAGNFVLGLLVDTKGNVWSGSWEKGVNVISKDRLTVTRYVKDKNNPDAINSNNANSFVEDSRGNIWIGTYGGGLNLFNRQTNSFTHFTHHPADSNSLSNNYIRCIFMDSRENIWIGTESAGLSVFDWKKNKFTHYAHQINNPKSISSNFINCIAEDSKGNIWIATGSGLNRFEFASNSFTAYNQENGLSGNLINAIQEDASGNLWISTNSGISKFDPQKKSFRNYTLEDGLQGNEFNFNASLKSRKGELYFGGPNGFTVFYPDSIRNNLFPPPVVLTDLQVFNKSVKVNGEDSLLQKDISETKEITLSYKHSVFSFEFAALNYTTPQKNQYAYQLEGFDKRWNYVGAERKATYTNLNPGKYTFRVKAANNDGVWNEEGTSVIIHIIPPWWGTWWFKTMAGLLCITFILAWYKEKTLNMRLRNKELEAKVQERTNQIERQKKEIESQRDYLNELNQEISYKNEELEKKVDERTAALLDANAELNASYAELINSSDKIKKSLHEKEVLLAEVHHRVKNNLAVISGLLQMQLFNTENQEVHAILQDSQNRIKSMALIHEKLYQHGTFASIEFSNYIQELVNEIKQTYPVQAACVEVKLDVDAINLELTTAIPCGLLLNELLTNAYKHAFVNRSAGQIEITFSKEDEYYLLKVSDNGVGVSHDFDIRKTHSIGMKLIHTLVTQLKGKMEYRNGNGLTFIVRFIPAKMKTWAHV